MEETKTSCIFYLYEYVADTSISEEVYHPQYDVSNADDVAH